MRLIVIEIVLSVINAGRCMTKKTPNNIVFNTKLLDAKIVTNSLREGSINNIRMSV